MGQDSPHIKGDILRTIAYHTAIGAAPTATELWRFQLEPTGTWSLGDILSGLNLSGVRERVAAQNGRFVLRGHEEIFDTLHERYLHADRKWRVARRYVRYMRYVPGVRAVAVCNSLVHELTSSDSDIDLFVITREHMIWLVRLLAIVPIQMMRRRPGQGHDDPICVSFLIDETALDFSKVHLQPKDVHMAHWLLSMIPMVDDGVFTEFLKSNSWARDMFPKSTQRKLAWYRRLDSAFPVWRITSRTANAIAKRIQGNRLSPEIDRQKNNSTDVIVNDSMLKFHVHDRRKEINKRFEELQLEAR